MSKKWKPLGTVAAFNSKRFGLSIMWGGCKTLKAEKDDISVVLEVVPKCIGGIGEKKSNSGSQFYQQDRIYDSEKVAASLSANLPGGANMYDIKMPMKEETNHGIFVKLENGDEIYAVWYPKKECYIAIRKLTPKECFRLQGWDDSYFEKAEFVCSNSQLYKQAGNGVTVNVIYEIAKRFKGE